MKSILPAIWKVPDRFRERLGETAGRQRAMAADGHLLLILHEPPGPDDVDRAARFFWRDDQGHWISNALGSGLQSLRKHLEEFTQRLNSLEDDLQAAHRAEDYFELLQAIAPLARTARNLHATLQEARELSPDDRDLISLRDQAGAIDRMAELLQADARHGLDFTIARASEQQSHRTYEMAISAHRLNILAAIFFPLATIAAAFGMNIRHGLEESGEGLFWTVMLVGVVVGVALAVWIVNRPSASSAPRRAPFDKKQ